MPPHPTRKRLPHEIPSWVGSSANFLIAICCQNRTKKSLTHPAVLEAMVAAWNHYAIAGRAWTRLFLAMPDHLRALISFPDDQRMTLRIRRWKRFAAKQTPVLWQDGFFDHRLRNESAFDEKAGDIRMSPARAGCVQDPSDWPFVWTPAQVYPAR